METAFRSARGIVSSMSIGVSMSNMSMATVLFDPQSISAMKYDGMYRLLPFILK